MKVVDGFFIYMKQFRNILLILSLIILIYGFGFICGLKYYQPQEKEIIRIDTIKITDTIEKPVLKYIRTIRTDTIITPNDTVFLPIEQKEYIHEIKNDTVNGSIKIVLNGYNPSLDSLQYNLSFTQKTLLKRKRMGFTIGVTTGVGYDFNKKINPFIGIGLTYGINL